MFVLSLKKYETMTINEEAIDYVFVRSKYGTLNVYDALFIIQGDRRKITWQTIQEYKQEKKKFKSKYNLTIERKEIKDYEIEREINKGINYITKRDSQTSIF